jgi:hypothetical protein
MRTPHLSKDAPRVPSLGHAEWREVTPGMIAIEARLVAPFVRQRECPFKGTRPNVAMVGDVRQAVISVALS